MGRGDGWDDDEVVALMQSYLRVSSNAATGTDQKSEAFYTSVYKDWIASRPNDHNDRSIKAIKARWKVLSPLLSYYNAKVRQALVALPSGWNEDDMVKKVLDGLSKAQLRSITPSALHKCWLIARDSPKWRLRFDQESANKRPIAEPQRPLGSKKAKLMASGAPPSMPIDLHRRFVKAAEERAEGVARKNDLKELNMMQSFFKANPDGEEAVKFRALMKETYVLRAQQMLRKLKCPARKTHDKTTEGQATNVDDNEDEGSCGESSVDEESSGEVCDGDIFTI